MMRNGLDVVGTRRRYSRRVLWTGVFFASILCCCSKPTGPSGAPAITTQPASQTEPYGQQVTFTVVATGNPTLAYQWHKDSANIPGAIYSSFTIAAVTFEDSGYYDVVVTNSAGKVISNAAKLSVNSALVAPNFTLQPLSQEKTIGEPVTFTASADGNPSPTYQWRKDGANIAGATAASYTISSVVLNSAGSYSVVAANSQGSLASNAALLLVTAGCPFPDTAQHLDPLDPAYHIITPNGGETFHVGQPCTLIVWSRLSGSAEIALVIGPSSLTPPEDFGAWGTTFSADSSYDTVVFTVPDSLWDKYSFQNVSSITDSCLFNVTYYKYPQFGDYSDCYFRIAK
ncbi:MAG TPA: immunoglobulin domain-containing protein [Chitinivibrionales bacterium]|nr:immunoglobulin domain-containing protein [Chitinivibrionales bacterium]